MVKVMKIFISIGFHKEILGEIIAHKDKCQKCQGNKIIEEQKNLEVVILPGYSHGKKIKFREENDRLVRDQSIKISLTNPFFSREWKPGMFSS